LRLAGALGIAAAHVTSNAGRGQPLPRAQAGARSDLACRPGAIGRKLLITAGSHSNPRGTGLALPTPVYPFRLGAAAEHAELWVKDDGAIHPLYGGNKARKLHAVMAALAAAPPRRLLTFGAAGSHHVLATALFAGLAGIPVQAVLLPEPHTEHVEATFRALLGQRISIEPALSKARAVPAFLRSYRRGDHVLGPGGAGLPATLAYVEAARELESQVEQGALPPPDEIVVALGSGTTAAGLLVGLSSTRLTSRVIAVQVIGGSLSRATTLGLAWRAARSLGLRNIGRLAERLIVERGELGGGYGLPTPSSEGASRRGADGGLSLDPTYTAKAFAHALARAARGPAGRVILYWHTLSTLPLAPLLAGAPALAELEPRLRQLLRPIEPRAVRTRRVMD
jgi:D-cysteine desulfhydrase